MTDDLCAPGIVLASNSEPLFHLWGFLACFSATFARALKSVLQGLLLTNENEKLDSLNLLLFMSPVALLVLVVAGSTSLLNPALRCHSTVEHSLIRIHSALLLPKAPLTTNVRPTVYRARV